LVRILWGKLIFFGRLQKLIIDYTLFKPSGEPLRAKIDLSFVGTMSAKEESLEAKRSSPDLTHEVQFQAGDSPPLMCHRIYGDSAYYAAVARYNNIFNFRAIRPGTTLFPPR
jgi:nucleoid-associated protein YgaU